MRFPGLIVVIPLFFVLASQGLAQSRHAPTEAVPLKGFLVQGGLVNLVEGDVQLLRGPSLVDTLKPNQSFNNGDTIQSGPSGRAEILLNPGYYLRIDHSTRISLVDISADNLKLKLWNGAAIVEVATNEMEVVVDSVAEKKELIPEPVSLLTPDAEYVVATGGAYRFIVNPHGFSGVSVVKGLAFVCNSRVADGMSATVDQGKVIVSPGPRPLDEFDIWSRQRAVNLVKANQSLSKTHWYKQVRANRGYLVINDPEDRSRATERLTVSAQMGAVALAEDTFLLRAGAPGWQRLRTGDTLIDGDRVRTAVERRAEIHPYPNCYLFLGSDTEIVYKQCDGQVAVQMVKGSAITIIDPVAHSLAPAVLTFVVDKEVHRISERGNYRINHTPDGNSDVLVYDGPLRVALNKLAATKKSDTDQDRLRFKKLTGDGFDVWSYRRSRLPAIRTFGKSFGPFGGMWCQNESTGQYTFVPARWEYSSPYGGRYSIKLAEDLPQEQQRLIPTTGLLPPLKPMRPSGP